MLETREPLAGSSNRSGISCRCSGEITAYLKKVLEASFSRLLWGMRLRKVTQMWRTCGARLRLCATGSLAPMSPGRSVSKFI